MAFGTELLIDGTGPSGMDANYHKLFIYCGSGADISYLTINRMWLDSFNIHLNAPESPAISSISSTWPEYKFFPFFFSSNYELTNAAILPFDIQYPDNYNYPYYMNVANGSIVHPLSMWSVSYYGVAFTGFNTSGFQTTTRRDNYRLPVRVKLRPKETFGDELRIDLMFSTSLKGVHTGLLNFEYTVVTPLNTTLNRTRSIPLNGVIHRSNFSEVDYTNFEDINIIEDVELSNPFVSIELS